MRVESGDEIGVGACGRCYGVVGELVNREYAQARKVYIFSLSY